LLTNQITTADFLLQIEYTVFGIFALPNVNAQPNLIFGSEFKLMINNGLDGCSQIDPWAGGKIALQGQESSSTIYQGCVECVLAFAVSLVSNPADPLID